MDVWPICVFNNVVIVTLFVCGTLCQRAICLFQEFHQVSRDRYDGKGRRLKRIRDVSSRLEVVNDDARVTGARSNFLNGHARDLYGRWDVRDNVRGKRWVAVSQRHVPFLAVFTGAAGVHTGYRCGQDHLCRQLVGVDQEGCFFFLNVANSGRAVGLRSARHEDTG